MAELLGRRRQLVVMLTAEQNRLGTARGVVKQDVQTPIEWLRKRLKDLDTETPR